jgi:hypothetical protein
MSLNNNQDEITQIEDETDQLLPSAEQICMNENNVKIFGKTFKMTRSQFTIISLLSFYYLLSSSYYSLLAPFLPTEAIKKGMSQSQVGIIFGSSFKILDSC